MTKREAKMVYEDEAIRRLTRWKFACDRSTDSFPIVLVPVDAGGGHAISAVIADQGVCLTVAVMDDTSPNTREFQFFTTESVKALRDVCDGILARGPMSEDPK